MRVYRVTTSKRAADISGKGAGTYPGRWNRKGSPVLYTAATREAALLETIAHMPLMLAPQLDIISLQIPDDSISEHHTNDLPGNHSHFPAPVILSAIGQSWINEGETVALKVPGSIVPSSSLFILNCNHPRYEEVKILGQNRFQIDLRTVK